jgi:AcrR family transcriptional regulator
MEEPRLTQAERRARSERSLLDAAEQLFAEKGSHRTSLAEIGERAGYSRGLVGERFGSKQRLVTRLTQRIRQRFLAQTLTPAVEGRSGLDGLLAAVDAYLIGGDRSGGAGRAFYVLLGESIGPVPEIRETFVAANAEFRATVEQGLRDGIAAGDIRPDVDPHAQAGLIVSTLRGILLQWLIDPEGIDVASLRRELRESLERSLRATPH